MELRRSHVTAQLRETMLVGQRVNDVEFQIEDDYAGVLQLQNRFAP